MNQKTFVTEYKGYNQASKIAQAVGRFLEAEIQDDRTQYVVTVEVRKVDDTVEEE